MSSKRILFFAVASIFLLVLVSRYGAEPEKEAPSSFEPADLNRAAQKEVDAAKESAPIQSVPATGESLTLTPDEKKKIELFREIVKSGNDNDPRVDRELNTLSPALKNALIKEYEILPKEHRNGRGFVAFLIGRSLSEPSDVEFLEKVVKEEPCLSFKDCDAKGPMYEEADEHSTNVTLDYPQIVAARMLKQNLSKAPPELRGRINEALATSRY